MIVLMCQDQFVPKILDGSKLTTIRRIRKRGNPKPGDILSLRRWTGKPYRSKQEEIKIVKCKSVMLSSLIIFRALGYVVLGIQLGAMRK